jgi:hypothetical protein
LSDLTITPALMTMLFRSQEKEAATPYPEIDAVEA